MANKLSDYRRARKEILKAQADLGYTYNKAKIQAAMRYFLDGGADLGEMFRTKTDPSLEPIDG